MACAVRQTRVTARTLGSLGHSATNQVCLELDDLYCNVLILVPLQHAMHCTRVFMEARATRLHNSVTATLLSTMAPTATNVRA